MSTWNLPWGTAGPLPASPYPCAIHSGLLIKSIDITAVKEFFMKSHSLVPCTWKLPLGSSWCWDNNPNPYQLWGSVRCDLCLFHQMHPCSAWPFTFERHRHHILSFPRPLYLGLVPFLQGHFPDHPKKYSFPHQLLPILSLPVSSLSSQSRSVWLCVIPPLNFLPLSQSSSPRLQLNIHSWGYLSNSLPIPAQTTKSRIHTSFCLPLYLQGLVQWLAHRRHKIKIYWKYAWMHE